MTTTEQPICWIGIQWRQNGEMQAQGDCRAAFHYLHVYRHHGWRGPAGLVLCAPPHDPALFGQAAVPIACTGTAVGLVSVIGYTPDILMGPVVGWLLDGTPGVAGHQHIFVLLFAFALLGLVASVASGRGTSSKAALGLAKNT